MRNSIVLLAWFLILLGTKSTFAQIDRVLILLPLESTREDVENILGKPAKPFDSHALYETEEAEFYFWYADGKCPEQRDGVVRYNVPDGRLTGIHIRLNKFAPLSKYLARKDDLKRIVHPTLENRFFYFSKDEARIFEAIAPNGNEEFLYSIDVQPGNKKRYLRCGAGKGPEVVTN